MPQPTVLLLQGTYDIPLVILSILITTFAAYAILDLAAPVVAARGLRRLVWLGGGSLATGIGLWAMQYVEMQAVRLPIPVSYDWRLVLASLAVAICTSAVGLFAISRRRIGTGEAILASLFAGVAISVMHQLGVLAMLLPAGRSYSLPLCTLSVVIAIFISFAAIKMAALIADRESGQQWLKASGALAMGVALPSLHYIGLAGVNYQFDPLQVIDLSHAITVSYLNLAGLSFLTLLILAFVFVSVTLDRRASANVSEIAKHEDLHKIDSALSAQRIARLQNDALADEMRERKKMEAALSHVAFHDSLTGLRNRAYFVDRLGIALARVVDDRKFRAAVIYIDLDNFKTVNDMLGHRAGDLMLTNVAQRLKSCTRDQDTLARLGGDEFTLLLTNLRDLDQAFRMARRLLTVIEEPMTVAGTILPVTASVGICEITPSYGEPEDLLRDADTAMYQAKRAGGASCVIFDSSMQEEAIAAMQAKIQLKAAVEKEQFELYYQPLVRLIDGSIYGMEALIRWNHPLRGLLGPGAFIDLAEETGYIVAIGTWVLQRSCADYQVFRSVLDRDLVLSVNVSTRQLDEPNFMKILLSVIEDSGIDPTRLQLEITESIFLKDAARIGAMFQSIRALGVRIAFDDFGTGYSSLSYLERYPIDVLKIDQSFVQNMRKGSVNASIVELVINMAHAIGMSVSAEGVEEPSQALALLDYGCTLAQGYLYSRPVSLTAMTDMLKRNVSLQKQQPAAHEPNRRTPAPLPASQLSAGN